MSEYQLLNTLYVQTEGSYLRLDNDTVRIELEKETRLRVPLHHLGGIVLTGDILISPALLGHCAERGVGIVFLDRNGRFRARVEGPMAGNVLLRQAQFARASDPVASLALARCFVAGKIRNTRHVLLRGARDSKSADDATALTAAGQHLEASLRACAAAADLDVLRGVEGEAARCYFDVFSKLLRTDLRTDFGLSLRSRRPPRDRINALLSFVYTLLTNECRSAAEAAGLDPQVGFLHVARPGRPALALDLVEEFRAILADRLVLTLINRGQVKAADFRTTDGGAVLMSDDAHRTVSIAWQERKKDEVGHPVLDADVPLGLLPQLQARVLARVLRGDAETYLPFLAR
ncbi:type I-C CRISPR-associated endonuclease Cas1c [Tahibacter sp.]|uniref:type I-C CRISPR-associated endonuclease Cas1c n=1 Tax=Tahibacter sp. TaxID=2056211 RepID=UPI0028C4CF64|nr:type I-C CRISPR-associated endonuclease Cas1c [Tahibacter sp.]